MSRQMAFQLTRSQVQEYMKVLIDNKKVEPGKTLGQWIDSLTDDQNERNKLTAAFIAAAQCVKHGRDILKVSKVICWRDPDGKPGMVQVEF